MGWRYIALLGFLKARELLKPEANGYQTALIICILFSCISIPKERNIPEKILLNAYRAVLEAVATRAARFIGDRAGLAATTAVRNRHCHPCPTPSALSTHGITEVQKELEGTHQDPWVHPALHSPQQSPCASEPCPNTSGTRAGVMLGSPSREACPRAHFPDFQPKCPASTSALCLCPRSQKQRLALPLSSQLRPQSPLLQTKSVHLLFRSLPQTLPHPRGLLWMFSNGFMSFFHRGAQKCTLCSRWGHSSAEGKEDAAGSSSGAEHSWTNLPGSSLHPGVQSPKTKNVSSKTKMCLQPWVTRWSSWDTNKRKQYRKKVFKYHLTLASLAQKQKPLLRSLGGSGCSPCPRSALGYGDTPGSQQCPGIKYTSHQRSHCN